MFDTADDLIAQLKFGSIVRTDHLHRKGRISRHPNPPFQVQYHLEDGTILTLNRNEWQKFRRWRSAQEKDNQRPTGTNQVQDKAAIG